MCEYYLEEKPLPDRNTGEINNIETGYFLSGARGNPPTEKIVARLNEPHKGVPFKHVNYDVYKREKPSDKWVLNDRFPKKENHILCEDMLQAKEITKKMFKHLKDAYKEIEV